ncbi:MAG: adenosylmethionine decarboxylase, partial [Erythrobacter sp.]|nr:adenosylmethionine decarboxylase [Erythrobacter sp.]
LLLAESHISVHTWPERDFAAFDIFMCGAATTSTAVQSISKCFEGAKIHLRSESRG